MLLKADSDGSEGEQSALSVQYNSLRFFGKLEEKPVNGCSERDRPLPKAQKASEV